jgi:hypothetical protein
MIVQRKTTAGWMLFVALAAAQLLIADQVDVKITPAMREYCHVVRFSQGWQGPLKPGTI